MHFKKVLMHWRSFWTTQKLQERWPSTRTVLSRCHFLSPPPHAISKEYLRTALQARARVNPGGPAPFATCPPPAHAPTDVRTPKARAACPESLTRTALAALTARARAHRSSWTASDGAARPEQLTPAGFAVVPGGLLTARGFAARPRATSRGFAARAGSWTSASCAMGTARAARPRSA